MHLQNLQLFNFKNYEEASLSFEREVLCFLGRNGSGKTNLLDAIHFLSFTKGAINPSDSQNVRIGQNQFLVKGSFLKSEKIHEVVCSYQGQKKMIVDDGQVVTRFSEHIGKYPVVLISPQDIELVWNGSEIRRKFFDSILSQMDKVYLENLIVYSNHLKQRNSSLKMFAETGKVDHDLLASYNQRMVPAGNLIHSKRLAFMNEFLPSFEKHYCELAPGLESPSINYKCDLDLNDFEKILDQNLSKDVALQRTTSGTHRDDYLFLINGNELSRFGSQGQQKSFLTSLKLAEFEIISLHKKFKPLLLLDDIFDRLDDSRISKLMQMIKNGRFGQLFITDARKGQCKSILETEGISFQSFEIENGKFG